LGSYSRKQKRDKEETEKGKVKFWQGVSAVFKERKGI
jgi:hypothetical protein